MDTTETPVPWTASTTPNVDLLRRTLTVIEADPANWNQLAWVVDRAAINPAECGTAYCFGGHAVLLHGNKLCLTDSGVVHPLLGDDVDPDDTWTDEDGRKAMETWDYARTILGLSGAQANALFHMHNELDDLRRIVSDICEETTPMSTTTLRTAPAILTGAAAILTAQGWSREAGYEHRRGVEPADCPLDLVAAIAKAAGIDIHSLEATNPNGVHADAVMLLAKHVLDAEPATTKFRVGRWLDELTDWQDEDHRTAEEVIAALRAAAGTACEHDPEEPIDRYAAAVTQALALAKIPARLPRVGAGISIALHAADAHLVWGAREGWSIHGHGPRREQTNTRYMRPLTPEPAEVATLTRAWLHSPDVFATTRTDYGSLPVDELNALLDQAANTAQENAR